jgi:hypothetical protein
MLVIACGGRGIAMANEALKALGETHAPYSEIPETFEALRVEGDRSLAIIAAELVENALETLLEEGWHRVNRTSAIENSSAPVGTFTTRPRIALRLV